MLKYLRKDTLDKNMKQDHIRSCDKKTGIPMHMKHYIEDRTGLSYDDVRIYYNSNKPSRFKALGYTQGDNVYLKRGQENHLMHELFHVAQQRKGLVRPTSKIGEYVINDDIKLEREAELCEKQYKTDVPAQMLREAVANGSKIMGKDGLFEQSLKYHTYAYFKLEGYKGDVVWSNCEHWMSKGGGDHAEDAICDYIEILDWNNIDLHDKELTIYLSTSPCQRCQERLNEISELYGLRINVICAREYRAAKGGGAGDSNSRQYSQRLLGGEEADILLQL